MILYPYWHLWMEIHGSGQVGIIILYYRFLFTLLIKIIELVAVVQFVTFIVILVSKISSNIVATSD